MSAALYAHRLFLRAGLAIANVFAWIFVFEYFSALAGDIARGLAATALLYALTQIIIVVATPMSAAHLRRGNGFASTPPRSVLLYRGARLMTEDELIAEAIRAFRAARPAV